MSDATVDAVAEAIEREATVTFSKVAFLSDDDYRRMAVAAVEAHTKAQDGEAKVPLELCECGHPVNYHQGTEGGTAGSEGCMATTVWGAWCPCDAVWDRGTFYRRVEVQSMTGKPAEQQARDMLEQCGVEDAQSFSAGDVVALANLIAEANWMRRQLAAPEPPPDRSWIEFETGTITGFGRKK